MNLIPAEAETTGIPRLVFFDEPSRELSAYLESGLGGEERSIAIATSRDGIGNDTPWKLLAAGASDVVLWDASTTGAYVAARLARWREIDGIVASDLVQGELVGRSPAWLAAVRRVVELACFTAASVLLTGESGTGKELVARLVHRLDRRPEKRDLVVVDCTTVVSSLSGSEFFGHEKGSFTGAVAPREGAFAAADRGTLFLDEVGELPLPLQAELLRVIQEGTYKRVGSNTWQRTSFRLVSATNRDLTAEQANGAFRQDLFYRIAAATVRLPRLEQRPEDILPLFRHFFAGMNPTGRCPEIDEPVRRVLLGRRYAGNVRDLRQLAARVASRHIGVGPITVGDLPEEERPDLDADGAVPSRALDTAVRTALLRGASLKEIRDAAADSAVRIAGQLAEGNLRAAAQMLGVTDRALQLRRAAQRRAWPPPDAVYIESGGEAGATGGADAGEPTVS